MNKSIKRIVSSVLGTTIFITGCKINLKNNINQDEIELPKNDYTNETESNIELDEVITIDKETYIIETTESNNQIIPSITETTEQTIENTEIIEQVSETIEKITETKKTIIETTKNEEIIEETKTLNYPLVSATTEVNIRSSNTTESLRIGNLKINQTAIKILICDNNWSLIKTTDQIGYVCTDYLTETSYIESVYEHIEQNDIVITTCELNIRTEPTTSAQIIKTFKKNTELAVIAKVNNGWLLVKNNGIIGYVHGGYTISLLETAREEYPELNLDNLDTKKIVYSTGNNLNIRTGNSTEHEIIRTLGKYESVRVLNEYDNWYFIMTNEYEFGYINKNYTKDLEGIFVIVDISTQRVYLYNNDELYLIGFVTTGKSSTPSDIGSFAIWYKGTDEEITPGHLVHYWMPYNLAHEGLHDAEEWRKDGYGTDDYIYNGSNGCINMLTEDAKIVYDNVSIGTKVLVHK